MLEARRELVKASPAVPEGAMKRQIGPFRVVLKGFSRIVSG